MEHLNTDDTLTEEKSPLFGSWEKIYLVVLLNLFVLIILFYFFSEAYK